MYLAATSSPFDLCLLVCTEFTACTGVDESPPHAWHHIFKQFGSTVEKAAAAFGQAIEQCLRKKDTTLSNGDTVVVLARPHAPLESVRASNQLGIIKATHTDDGAPYYTVEIMTNQQEVNVEASSLRLYAGAY
jgi:hypothetical protein